MICKHFTKMRSIIAIFLLIISPLILLVGSDGLPLKNSQDTILDNNSDVRSLAGIIEADDGGNLRIIGEYFGGSPSKLGEEAFIKDLDKDGIDDLCISCPYCPGSDGRENGGRIYVWYGSNITKNGTVDLSEDSPSLTIYGGHVDSELGSDVGSGDINGDGYVDLVLGVSQQPECGRVYIIWGKEGGLRGDLYLEDIDIYEPNGNPLGFLNTAEYSIIGSWMKPVPAPFSNYLVGEALEVEDLDGDGFDDLVFSSPGWNNVSIVWGVSDSDLFGNQFTQIWDSENEPNNGFGEEIEIGDIDGDGTTDMIISSPRHNILEESKYSVGSVFTFFNPGELKGFTEINARVEARPIIIGDDAYDGFGSCIDIEDLNGDGKGDIIAGSPGSDGSKNNRKDTGAIFVYFGDQENTFPKTLMSSQGEDIVIHGELQSSGDISGDKIGYGFSVGDFDGNGRKDLVIGIPGRDGSNGLGSGMVIGIKGESAFPLSGGSITLSSDLYRFQIVGISQEFGLGSVVDTGDLNNDGVSDLLCTAPSGDGIDLERPGCGEAFLFYGSGIIIEEIAISGEGAYESMILMGNGEIRFNLTTNDKREEKRIDEFRLKMEISGKNIQIIANETGILDIEFGQEYISVLDDDLDIYHTDNRLYMAFNLTLDWLAPLSGKVDITASISVGNGSIIRDFPQRFEIARDVKLEGNMELYKNNVKVSDSEKWFKPGDMITFEGLDIVYQSAVERNFTGGELDIVLKRDDLTVNWTSYEVGWALGDLVTDGERINYSISIRFNETGNWPSNSLPDLGSPIKTYIIIDGSIPPTPGNVYLDPDGYGIYNYDDDLEWTVFWDRTLEVNKKTEGSGIYSFEVNVEGGSTFYASRMGGLWGSYFSNNDFTSCEISKIDQKVDFDWGKFSPYPNNLSAYDFSVRWHGWFKAPDTTSYRFSIGGRGEAKMILKGEQQFDFSNLETNPMTGDLQMKGGELYYIEILYRRQTESGGGEPVDNRINLQWDVGAGTFKTIPSTLLYYPSNRTNFKAGGKSPFNVSVRSVNWVGSTSSWVKTMGFIDTEGPRVDLSETIGWYGNSKPEIVIRTYDLNIGSYPGSGLDPEGIQYRLRLEGETQFSDWYDSDISIRTIGKDGQGRWVNRITSSPILTQKWRGRIQWKLKDMVGNEYITSQIWIGIDTEPPETEVVHPEINLVQQENEFIATILFSDGDGSGVAGASSQWRYMQEGGDWSIWMDIDENDSGSDIYVDLPMKFENGRYEIQFRVYDLVGNLGTSENMTLIVEKPPENQPPIPNINLPKNGSRVSEGQKVFFDATGTSDDGIAPLGHLLYTWFSDIDGFIGNGKNISSYLSLGNHTITLYVTDGGAGNNVSVSIELEVFEVVYNGGGGNGTNDEEDNGLDVILILIGGMIVLILFTIGIYALISYRSRSEEQTQIGYKRISEDDYDYDKRLEEEEKELGLRESDNEKSSEEIEEERRKLYSD